MGRPGVFLLCIGAVLAARIAVVPDCPAGEKASPWAGRWESPEGGDRGTLTLLEDPAGSGTWKGDLRIFEQGPRGPYAAVEARIAIGKTPFGAFLEMDRGGDSRSVYIGIPAAPDTLAFQRAFPGNGDGSFNLDTVTLLFPPRDPDRMTLVLETRRCKWGDAPLCSPSLARIQPFRRRSP